MTESQKNIKEIEKEVKERLEDYEKTKANISSDELISEDKGDYKELIKNNDQLKEMVNELLMITRELSKDNEKLREHLQNGRNAMVADYYRQKLKHTGILNEK